MIHSIHLPILNALRAIRDDIELDDLTDKTIAALVTVGKCPSVDTCKEYLAEALGIEISVGVAKTFYDVVIKEREEYRLRLRGVADHIDEAFNEDGLLDHHVDRMMIEVENFETHP